MSDPKRDALEADLLRRFDALHPKEEKPMFTWKTMLVAAAVLLAAGAAPAQYAAEVGKKVQIHVSHPARDMPAPDEVPEVLREAGTRMTIEIRVQHSGDAADYEYQLWGDGIAGDIEARLRSAFPALKDAQITVSSIEGQVKTSLAGLLEKKLLQAGDDPVKIEAARREVQSELQKDHPDAKVEVEIAPDGKRRVKVIDHQGKK